MVASVRNAGDYSQVLLHALEQLGWPLGLGFENRLD
jgi:hypothetical protein